MNTLKMALDESHEILGLKLAPLLIPIERRLQMLGVLHFWYIFMLSIFTALTVLVVLALRGYYLVVLGLLLWAYIDRETPLKGGRRSHRLRNWSLFKYMVDYFPYKLIKTADLDPNGTYLCCFHPHGITGLGVFAHFATEGSNFSKIFPGITPYPLTLHGWFRFPLVRGYLMATGLCSVRKESVDWILSRPGSAAALIVGGARESLEAKPGTNRVVLSCRKGFIKRAIINGAHLVPIYSFGETDMYDQVDNEKNPWLRQLQLRLTKIIGVAPPLYHGRGMFNYNAGLLPYRVPIHTVVGEPLAVEKNLEPSDEEIQRIHGQYVEALTNLFEEHKLKYGLTEEDKLEVL